MRILLVNDDGYQAKGLNVLKSQLEQEGHDICVVAPDIERSCLSHSMTYNQDLFMTNVGKNFYSVNGTSVDCTILGLDFFSRNGKIDLLISGINDSENIGREIIYSGTVAAAREAGFHGIRSLAVSVVKEWGSSEESKHLTLQGAAKFVATAVSKIDRISWNSGSLMNINYPNQRTDDIIFSRISERSFLKKRIDFREGDNLNFISRISVQGLDYSEGSDGDDISVIAQKKISVSLVNLFPESLPDVEVVVFQSAFFSAD